MNEFWQAFGPARVLNLEQVLVALLAAFAISVAIASVYRWTYEGLSYSRSFVHTMVLSSVVTAMLIMAIGNNLARGLGILGTLAIVRFRTPIRDPRDIIFLFACLAVGIACGASVFSVAIVGALFFCLAALYLHRSPFASLRVYEGLLRFYQAPGTAGRSQVEDVLKRFCSSVVLVALREAAQGEALECSYQVRLIDPTYQGDLLDALAQVPGVSDVNLLMHRATVEI